MDSINWLPDLQLHTLLLHLSQVLFAFVLAVPIGWNRETRSRSAGLRTFPLVALGACAFILVGKSVIESADANARLVQGLIGGLGFLGGGAIIKHDNAVIGTATAARPARSPALRRTLQTHTDGKFCAGRRRSNGRPVGPRATEGRRTK